MVFLFGSGVFVNLKTANWFLKFLGYISPLRYTIENLLRVLLKDLDYVDSFCD
jgi:ABC-type multidrug transport system permease subunit